MPCNASKMDGAETPWKCKLKANSISDKVKLPAILKIRYRKYNPNWPNNLKCSLPTIEKIENQLNLNDNEIKL